MKQAVPLGKQSKRAQKEYHSARRGSWYGLSPVTRVAPNRKAYDRKRTKQILRADLSC